MSNIKKHFTILNLKCQLTKRERLEFADALHEAIKKVADGEATVKAAKSDLAVAKNEKERLARLVSTGVEYRDIDVEEKLDFNEGRYYQTRIDTGEVILDRPLNDSEKQLTLVDQAKEGN